MSLASITYWAPAATNLATIASLQTLTSAGNLVLNTNVQYQGANVNNVAVANPPYVFNNVVRSVSLTSTGDLSGTVFTVNGFGSEVDSDGNPLGPTNQPLSVALNGPNNNTVDTYSDSNDGNPYIFSSVTSISSAAPVATSIRAGFGINGITDYVFMDYDRFGWYASASAQIVGSGTALTYSFYGSLNKPSYQNNQGGLSEFPVQIPAYKLDQLSNFGAPINTFFDENTSQFTSIPSPIATAWFTVTQADYSTSQSAYFTILQQGVR